MPDKIYNISYKKFIKWNVPFDLRKPKMMALLTAFVRPIVQVYQAFYRNRKSNLYKLLITPQVCYLERMLNDRFDATQRRIFIGDGEWHDPFYLYQEAELKDQYLYTEAENQPVYLWTDSEAGDYKDDFIVFVPKTLVFNINEMKGLLDVFKLVGTRYKIELI